MPLTRDDVETLASGVVALKKPQQVYAIRVKISFARDEHGYANVTLHWRAPEQDGRPSQEKSTGAFRACEPGQQNLMFWVNDVVGQFWLDMGRGSSLLSVRDILLLLPETPG